MALIKNEPPIQCDDVEAWVSCGTDRKVRRMPNRFKRPKNSELNKKISISSLDAVVMLDWKRDCRSPGANYMLFHGGFATRERFRHWIGASSDVKRVFRIETVRFCERKMLDRRFGVSSFSETELVMPFIDVLFWFFVLVVVSIGRVFWLVFARRLTKGCGPIQPKRCHLVWLCMVLTRSVGMHGFENYQRLINTWQNT